MEFSYYHIFQLECDHCGKLPELIDDLRAGVPVAEDHIATNPGHLVRIGMLTEVRGAVDA